ncbi:hypothetical protein TWF703_004825 [Orbilia oligospora]|uniref:Glucose-methanol-choline oxidoreductase N-terminal domain-containing protein n=1 Tax=Orbilia oligospora TaxID=2813651 RepID=A0A7C8P9H4_ORBOL|nr:hypothetical protein TWF703_004825 [Orbilia oligospora]
MFISKLVAPIATVLLCLGGANVVEAITASAFAAVQFDYIIVGGGTAGLVVAGRLSANPHIKVGVLEAGTSGLDDPIIYTPGKVGWAVGTQYDWSFMTEPQTELGNRPLFYSRGKALGGSSAINFFVWMRGNKPDYDAWASLGNPGWDFNSLIPYFKKPETFHAPSPADELAFKLDYNAVDHGTDGPINTCFSNQYGGTHQHWHQTLNNLGIPSRDSFNGSNWGVWTGLTNVNPINRTRSYSASQYYRPHAARPNLHVLTEAMVRKVIIQTVGGHKTATGVIFSHGGVDYTVNAASEVILSAGTIQSPQLLELSGIGNPTYLTPAGVTVLVNSPHVGENLQDRIMNVLLYELDPSVENQGPLQDPVELADAEDEYYTNHTGLLTVLPNDFAYLPLNKVMNESYVNHLRSLVSGTDDRTLSIKSKLDFNKFLGNLEYVFDPNILFAVGNPDPLKKYGTVFQMLQYPFSTGHIHIQPPPIGVPLSSSQHPVINPRYFEGDGIVDMLTLAEGLKFADSIARQGPLNAAIVKREVPPEPAPGTETDWLQFVKDNTVSDWHPVGTCAMSGLGIHKGVVDEKLRVHGVKRLRVVDASIIPVQISSHLQGTVYAIAEKGADMILQDFECKRRRRRGRRETIARA